MYNLQGVKKTMNRPSQAFYDAIDKHFTKNEQKELFVEIEDDISYLEDDEQIFPENFRKIGLYGVNEGRLVIIKNPDIPSEEWITARFAKKEVFQDLTRAHSFRLIIFRNIDFTDDFFDFTNGYFDNLLEGKSMCFINCKIDTFPPEFFDIKFSELDLQDCEIKNMVFSSFRAKNFYIRDTVIHKLGSTDGTLCDDFSLAFTKSIRHSMEEYIRDLLSDLKLQIRRRIFIYISNSIMNTLGPKFCTLLLNSIEPREVVLKNELVGVNFNFYKGLNENIVKFPVLDPYYYEPGPVDDNKYQYIYWVPYSDYTKIDLSSNSIYIDLTGVEAAHSVPIHFNLDYITKVPLNIEYFNNLDGISFDSDITNLNDINVSAFKSLKFFRVISISSGSRYIDRFNVKALSELKRVQNFIKSYEFKKLNIDISNINNQSFNLFKKNLSINRSLLCNDEILLELIKPEFINIDVISNLRRLAAIEKLNIKLDSVLLDFLDKIKIEYPHSKLEILSNSIRIFFK
jgi:hypothetical protein